MVPLHSGHSSGKWLTKVPKENCLSFVSHFVWEADISGTFHLYHTRAPGTTRECLMAELVWSRDTSPLSWFHQGLSGASEITEQARGWGGWQMHHHNNPEAHHWRCMENSLCVMENQRETGFQFCPKNKRRWMLACIWIFLQVGIIYRLKDFLLV